MLESEIKPFLNYTKLIFSSLFGRQMPYAILGCPQLKDNEFIFTNVTIEEAEIYEANTEQYFHLVTFRNYPWLDVLFSQYPVLNNSVLFLDVRTFMSCLNKSVKTLHQSKLYLVGQELLFDSDDVLMPCGQLITSFLSEQYYAYHQAGIPKETHYTEKLKIENYLTEPVYFIPISGGDKKDNKSLKSKTMMLPGKNTICFKEFIPKAKPVHPELTLTCGGSKAALQTQLTFVSDEVDVISSHPNMRYYAR